MSSKPDERSREVGVPPARGAGPTRQQGRGHEPSRCAGHAEHDDADCAAVMAEVWTLLDGECTPETRDKLRHHLEACPGCLRHYGVEERIKQLIAAKCGGEKAPEGLRQRLLLEIQRTTIIRY